MTFGTLIRRSLRFHARAHAGVVLGAMIGSAALIGALVVGDSVKGSLRENALRRLANASYVMAPTDRTFSQALEGFFLYGMPIGSLSSSGIAPNPLEVSYWYSTNSASALTLPATASLPSGTARANHAVVYGVREDGRLTLVELKDGAKPPSRLDRMKALAFV